MFQVWSSILSILVRVKQDTYMYSCLLSSGFVSGTTDLNHLPWPGTNSDHLWQFRTNKLLPTGRIQKRSKGKRRLQSSYPTTSQNPFHWNPSWLSDLCNTRKDPAPEWLARDNLEPKPVTINPKTASHMAEQFSWVPSPSCFLLRCPYPIKSLVLSAQVSSRKIHFWVSDKSPPSGLGRGSPFLQVSLSLLKIS